MDDLKQYVTDEREIKNKIHQYFKNKYALLLYQDDIDEIIDIANGAFLHKKQEYTKR